MISDVEKPTSKEAIAKLKQAGIQKTIMLTGDAKQVADQVAADLGMMRFTANCFLEKGGAGRKTSG